MEMSGFILVLAAVALVCEAGKPYSVVHKSFKLGSTVDLTCGNKSWSEMVYVIWKLDLKYKKCSIALEYNSRLDDTCKDGKALVNTTSARSYLHIPSLKSSDEGFYECDLAFEGGAQKCKIQLVIIVPPSTSAWLEWRNGKRVAVCRAENGQPAANISWNQAGNPSNEIQTNSDGSQTVVSLLELPEGRDAENLTCVIRHPYWENEEILEAKPYTGLAALVSVLTVAAILAFLIAFFLVQHKKGRTLRCCWKADPSLSKSQLTEDVEEVEPYASYVQRVNSIYNS